MDYHLSSVEMDQLSSLSLPFVIQVLVVIVVSVLLLVVIIPLCTKGCSKKSKQMPDGAGDRNSVTSKMVEDLQNGDPAANGRSIGGPDRALPELPPSSGITSTDDDEEEDEGHYDIISRRKNQSNSVPTAVVVESAKKKKGQAHPYETVRGDPDSDSTYAGIKDDSFSKSKSTDFPGDQTLVADPLYAGIQDGGTNEASGGVLYSIVGNRTAANRGRNAHSLTVAISENNDGVMNAVGGSLFSVPPIPDKIDGTDAEDGSDELSVGANLVGNSPLLPPRNGDAANGNTLWNNGAASNGHSTNSRLFHLQQPAAWSAGSSAVVSIYNGVVVDQDSSNVDSAGASGPQSTNGTKRVPDYSSVTARESLENLRKRQQLASQQNQVFVDLLDGTYDTINYDLIKPSQDSQNNRSGREASMPNHVPLIENVYNTGSDLYAEIGTGPSSTRSSTYARVTEVSILDSAEHAPLPPSVDTLQQLTHAVMDDLADPGYSLVDPSRLRNVNPRLSSTSNASNLPGQCPPVYAMVNKPSKSNPSRQTIHVDDDVERGLANRHSPFVESELYSKVTKPKQRPLSSSGGPNSSTASDDHEPLLTSVAFAGARPKVRSNGHVLSGQGQGQESTHFRIEPGYASIDNVLQSASSNGADPDYDVVGDPSATDGVSDYDPSYETVALTRFGQTTTVRCLPGVAREILPTSSGAMHVDHHQLWHHPRREHIYEVVKETNKKGGANVSSVNKSKNSTDV